ncbi:hypothetical protein Goarm_003661, partial [Gossypium armourianum]|nr:hypothetical protein [Gossypium armourianum]
CDHQQWKQYTINSLLSGNTNTNIANPFVTIIGVTPTTLNTSTSVVGTSTVLVSKATSLVYVTKEEVQRIHEEKNKSLGFSKFDLKLLYLAKVASKPYPEDYTSPKFKLHLENIALPTFTTLVEATRRTNNTIQRQRGANHFARRDTPTVNVIQGEGIEKRKKRSSSYDRFSEHYASRISERDFDGNYEFRAFN